MSPFRALSVLWLLSMAGVFALAGGQQKPTACRAEHSRPTIIYEVRGGMLGRQSVWSIYPDGLICRNRVDQGKIPAEDLRKLMDQITAAGFFSMPKGSHAKSKGPCYQCNLYTITVIADGQEHTVKAYDGAAGVPAGLWDILSSVRHVISH